MHDKNKQENELDVIDKKQMIMELIKLGLNAADGVIYPLNLSNPLAMIFMGWFRDYKNKSALFMNFNKSFLRRFPSPRKPPRFCRIRA